MRDLGELNKSYSRVDENAFSIHLWKRKQKHEKKKKKKKKKEEEEAILLTSFTTIVTVTTFNPKGRIIKNMRENVLPSLFGFGFSVYIHIQLDNDRAMCRNCLINPFLARMT